MLEKYPYLTEIYNKKFETKTICLIQSVSKNYISFYNLQELKPMDIEKFFRLADNWWKNSSNIPISLYYQNIFEHNSFLLS